MVVNKLIRKKAIYINAIENSTLKICKNKGLLVNQSSD